MKDPVVIIGIGEIGAVFARGMLRSGHPVYPITRNMDIGEELRRIPEPALVMVAVGEADLYPTLAVLPAPWKQRLALIQNELLPTDWQQHDLADPTVISVWFEKKKGQDVKIVVPSPIYGMQAGLLSASLAALDIPHYLVHDQDQLLFELVRKKAHYVFRGLAT